MANRNFVAEKGTLRRGVVSLKGVFNIGGTGAITAVDPVGKTGFTVARTGSGNYTITLADAYRQIVYPSIIIMPPGSVSVGDCVNPYVLTAVAATKTITFTCRNGNGTLTVGDPPSGSVIFIDIDLVDSSV